MLNDLCLNIIIQCRGVEYDYIIGVYHQRGHWDLVASFQIHPKEMSHQILLTLQLLDISFILLRRSLHDFSFIPFHFTFVDNWTKVVQSLLLQPTWRDNISRRLVLNGWRFDGTRFHQIFTSSLLISWMKIFFWYTYSLQIAEKYSKQ